jgi:hypothetical protein
MKNVIRQREVTFEIEIDKIIKATAKGYSKQAVKVFGLAESALSFTMDGTTIPILEIDKKNLSGEIIIAVGTSDVLSIKKTIFGVKAAEIDSI